MKTYSQFITEAAADIFGDEEEQKRVAKRDADQARRRAARTGVSPEVEAAEAKRKSFEKAGLSPEEAKRKAYRNVQPAAQKASQTRSSRTAPNRPYGGEYTPPDVDKKTSRVGDAFKRGREGFNKAAQGVKDRASKVGDAVKDFANKAADTTPRQAAQSAKQAASNATQGVKDAASKVKDAAKNAPNDLKTKLKYGRKIRPNSSTSALANRSTDLAKAASTTSKFSKGLKLAGRAAAPVGFAADVASERSKGSGWARSLLKGAVTAAGGAAGAAGGSAAGPVGTVAGGVGGAAAASKAFDVAAGKNAKERAEDRVKNRQRQAGGALVGTGGKTTFDTKKNTMTTGKKTVSLAKTSVVKDPKTGKEETGHLAYKDGKAVYKRAAKPGEGSSNAFERIGRAINPNAYKANDAKLAAAKLNQAKANDAKRNQALGIKPKK
jgi:hypothetical protein